ncbi:hypothetical protein Tter_2837 [Thermobaculum terrenum ATCC BAA-798]|uniref:Uncharacterized protein n=1 Tax=Thermobaculum terrenum (strain ATCC BAA-798 / CCMEE 7001 / YNP1) TaxID=525904 RepID=D1CJ00_THET1|nr:hypothetical protein Tter_2837 [Thermobaculum terrenum ATCC BAA-798]
MKPHDIKGIAHPVIISNNLLSGLYCACIGVMTCTSRGDRVCNCGQGDFRPDAVRACEAGGAQRTLTINKLTPHQQPGQAGARW